MLEDELDIAYKVILGEESRGFAGKHSVEHFRDNSS